MCTHFEIKFFLSFCFQENVKGYQIMSDNL
jgi:hypothetical protein